MLPRTLTPLVALLLTLYGTTAAAGDTLLAVPFLPQTEALCGGAAAAMVYRYWGDLHADVQQFSPLVDRRAGGIRDTDLVAAMRGKGWVVDQSTGSIATVRDALANRRPVILLIADRPSRYHFVVAVGTTDDGLVVHDPTWGPNRRLSSAVLTKAWEPAHFWTAIVTPGARTTLPATSPLPNPAPARSSATPACDRALDAALDEIAANGLTAADSALGTVRAQCPGMAGPLRELAGVRVAQARWREASALARQAVHLDPADRYAWDVLGSSLLVLDDTAGALRAWNHIGNPRLDAFDIQGLNRTRYSLVARLSGLTPNTMLTSRAFALAERRVEQLPDRLASSVTVKALDAGFASVSATLQEVPRRPRTPAAWGATALRTIVNREAVVPLAGWSGQGDMWTASWRWWENRPRVAGTFAAPIAGPFGGVWRVDAAWEAQTYAVNDGTIRESRRTGLLSWRNWLTPETRVELRAGADGFDDRGHEVTVGATLEQRLFGDRLAVAGAIDRWRSFGRSDGFSTAGALASFASRKAPRGFVAVALARVDLASDTAPHALWSGAGEGRGRPGLIRAHRMVHEGVIDGSVFGRRSGSTNLELQRWFPIKMASVAVAGFSDIGGAAHRLPGAHGHAWLVDAGAGLRARIAGTPGLFRLDYAEGLRDNARRLSVGWDLGK